MTGEPSCTSNARGQLPEGRGSVQTSVTRQMSGERETKGKRHYTEACPVVGSTGSHGALVSNSEAAVHAHWG